MYQGKNIAIENLRGIAALFVAAYHFYAILGIQELRFMRFWGEIGVDLFFIISGYLIFRSFERGHHKFGWFKAIKLYWINRIFRMVPAYYFNLFVIMLVTPFILHEWVLTSGFFRQVIHHLTFSAYVVDLGAVGWGLNGAYWTLTIEMMWYALAPVLCIFLKSKTQILIAIGFSCLYFFLLDCGFMQFAVKWLRPSPVFKVSDIMILRWLSNQLPGQFLFFGAGILFYKTGFKSFNFNMRHPIGLGLILIAVFIGNLFNFDSFLIRNMFFCCATSLIFLVSMVLKPEKSGILAWFGKISYSIYLWHFPLLAITNKTKILSNFSLYWFGLIYAILLITISSFSYYFIEERGLTIKQQILDQWFLE